MSGKVTIIAPINRGGIVKRTGVMLRLFSLPYGDFNIRLIGDVSAMLESRSMSLDALAPFRLLVKILHDNVRVDGDLIHAFFWYFKPSGLRRLILETDQSPSQYLGNYLNISLNSSIVRSLYGKSVIVTWSRWARDGFLRDGFKIENIKVVPLPYVPNVMTVNGVHKVKAVVFIGYDYFRKGGDVALRVFRAIKEYDSGIKTIYVGELPYPKVPRYVDEYYPLLNRSKLLMVIAKSMVMLAPSRHDAYNVTAMEAMANKTVVVSSKIEGIGELVASNGGIVCDLSDVNCFIENTLKNLDSGNHEAVASRQLNGLKVNHNIEFIFKQMKAIYEEAMGR